MMVPKKILANLRFVAEVPAKRQIYYVYEGDRHYVLMTISPSKKNSFNFNLVLKEATDYVMRSFKGRKQLTSSELAKKSKKPAYIKTSLDALNVLYALCASGSASIDHRFSEQKSLYFNLKRD